MFKFCISLFFIVFSIACSGQGSDLLLLKKKNGKTLKTYTSGIFIKFTDINSRPVEGTIFTIKKDSVFINDYNIRRGYTIWGTSVMDTLSSFKLRFHYNDIVYIAKEPKGFEFIRDGTIFIIGGTAYALLHTINSLIQKDAISPKVLAISGGVILTGVVMKLLRKRSYRMGEKYSLKYISLTR